MCQAYGFLVLLLSSPSGPGRGRLLGRRSLALFEDMVLRDLDHRSLKTSARLIPKNACYESFCQRIPV